MQRGLRNATSRMRNATSRRHPRCHTQIVTHTLSYTHTHCHTHTHSQINTLIKQCRYSSPSCPQGQRCSSAVASEIRLDLHQQSTRRQVGTQSNRHHNLLSMRLKGIPRCAINSSLVSFSATAAAAAAGFGFSCLVSAGPRCHCCHCS